MRQMPRHVVPRCNEAYLSRWLAAGNAMDSLCVLTILFYAVSHAHYLSRIRLWNGLVLFQTSARRSRSVIAPQGTRQCPSHTTRPSALSCIPTSPTSRASLCVKKNFDLWLVFRQTSSRHSETPNVTATMTHSMEHHHCQVLRSDMVACRSDKITEFLR
ncbi:hypothetical protein P171DRAFT_142510 [Karstenula rhodostoma CBS 690.94]|uniref:Uncharacterized protein n=1 Tax=Karstenula rhodostoma CBS 690.94 TaxID=1392251 RepID=A0A9P4UIS0_9PLEO|nr:hypothetical protein P171DRAFT_142510 [Karstenula rhodostoma CBS 690.94]